MSISGCASVTYNIYIIWNPCILSNTYLCHHFYGTWFQVFCIYFSGKNINTAQCLVATMVRGGGEAAAAAETKAPGIFSPNSGVPTYFTHSHSDFAANETETFCKKKKKNWKTKKTESFFFSSFEWSTKKCHHLFQVCDPKTYRQ